MSFMQRTVVFSLEQLMNCLNLCPSLPQHVHPPPPTFMDSLNWHNPTQLNSSQSMAKWASHFALGLSNSVPGIDFDLDDILVTDNIVAGDLIMTDGCGFINLAAMRKIIHSGAMPLSAPAKVTIPVQVIAAAIKEHEEGSTMEDESN
ncbi:hypothetical protein EDD16DRAFT_1712010 [Pisolithus croceorrhizus]|nr:hypothetical protein EDD16DRAFT_1712010 [Pisolithus croceorrhizus]KAI6113976.1 hypothetical protein EV401DRAFT_2102030 [Pisolithus croceorrhizus]